MGATFYLLAMASYGASADETVIRLSPRVASEAAVPTLGDLMAWSVGLGVLALAVWFVPRAILAGLLALVLVPASLAKEGIAKPLQQVMARKAFAVAGAAAAFLAAYVACNASVFDKNISPIMPVLRNNFWLTSHVLTITASYGAGALAWGLANIALGYYLFGRYRAPDDGPIAARNRRPPEFCAVLAAYIYKAAQVAVVLLIGGTILGALWADVSWGRFWGWDSKEVWALISALVYLAILHGRYAGLFGNLGVAVGAVFGAASILLAWYGVNYLFGSGLHTYGSGTGGQSWVILALGLNWTFVAAALVRHRLETAMPAHASPAGEKAQARARLPNRATKRASTVPGG
jgi:ABC-type transport system involved in cytochrome c biogenesis permease subunit